MIRAGSGFGRSRDPVEAALDAALAAHEHSGAERAELCLVFSIAQPVRVGQTIQFQIRDGQAAAQDLRRTLQTMTASLSDRRPAFGVYFNCVGRGVGLFGEPDHDVRLIAEQLGRFPLAGFFGNGEFAPVAARNCFHNYTGVLVVFPEHDARPTA